MRLLLLLYNYGRRKVVGLIVVNADYPRSSWQLIDYYLLLAVCSLFVQRKADVNGCELFYPFVRDSLRSKGQNSVVRGS